MTDTLVMTGVLMALILLVRRPVGRWFGPSAAYALWALPMIRLLLPPLVLPQSLAIATPTHSWTPPADAVAEVTAASYAYDEGNASSVADAGVTGLPWATILVAVWLAGAVVFLVHRFFSYHAMRRELLREARVIGHSGAVRIVESSAVSAPVAFGVIDRVVALPRGFLAEADSDASDFAITHELEHHAGNDLVANIAVQPLFALHWFNPLAWVAWRALRSDQEAACDARVMAGRSRRERERYGRLIASFAAGSRFALAAPMAGPLKGDKPIIHRLKALVRNDVPERHRLLGRSLFAISIVAVPLTASVTYAAQEAEENVAEPLAAIQPAANDAPIAPASSHAVEHDGSAEAGEAQQRWSQHRSARHEQAAVQAGSEHPVFEAELERTVARSIAGADLAAADADLAAANAVRAEREAERLGRDAERAAARAEHDAARQSRLALAQAPKVLETVSPDGNVQTLRIVTPARAGRPRFTRTMVLDGNCPADQQHQARAAAGRAMAESRVCTGAPDTSRHVALALRRARASVAANGHMPAKVRSDLLADLDEEIAEATQGHD
ncbi:beta-lactamase regulating signal transducer with metallopeptidase domain [Novosphingobium chloroacetimidivorans]|uniref:Beta-lactamase regulating signal transducer with metallopeptidase domain n=1 Tax=Novosphingobium chloroacetimidivorans TaxID=1428314 RepID=A0A7W7KBG8_9SPHN|nr:beta-lactamase regulating signal transducer with metallopeptidase domain [Novosphingobium chloroacetimidivorans]